MIWWMWLLLIAVVALPFFVGWLLMLIEAVRTPREKWDAAGQNQFICVLLMVFLGVVGTIVYVVAARPRLRAVGTGQAAVSA